MRSHAHFAARWSNVHQAPLGFLYFEEISISETITEQTEPSPCPYDPRELLGQPIGMLHCPLCGEMVVAGLAHPQYPVTIWDAVELLALRPKECTSPDPFR